MACGMRWWKKKWRDDLLTNDADFFDENMHRALVGPRDRHIFLTRVIFSNCNGSSHILTCFVCIHTRCVYVHVLVVCVYMCCVDMYTFCACVRVCVCMSVCMYVWNVHVCPSMCTCMCACACVHVSLFVYQKKIRTTVSPDL